MSRGNHAAPRPPRRHRLGGRFRVKASALLIALSVIGLTLATIASLAFINSFTIDTRRLTTEEITKVRELIQQRGQVRTAEQERRDRVLCTTLAILAGDTTTSSTERSQLVAAARELECPTLPTARSSEKPSPTSTPTSSPTSTSRSPSDADTTGSRSSSTPPKAPTTRPTTRPTPSPTSTSGNGLLDPVTDPVCEALGICL